MKPDPSANQEKPIDLADIADLTQAVAHEFNNLLNNILLQAAVLEQTEPSLASDITPISRYTQEAAGLVQQLQDVCRRARKPLGPIDLNLMIREVVEGNREGAEPLEMSSAVHIQLDLADRLGPILGNPIEVRRLLRYLIESAGQAMGDREGTVRLHTQQTNHGGVRLTVEDEGPSPNPEALERLGEPFLTVRPGSDGIRLACCQSVVRRLQGTFRAQNRPGGGMACIVDFSPAPS